LSEKHDSRASRREVVQTLGGLAVLSTAGLAGCSGGDDPAPAAEPAAPAAAAKPEPQPVAPQPKPEPEPVAEQAPETVAEEAVEPAPEPVAEKAAEPKPAVDPESLPKLTEDDAAASALGYRHNASDVDTAKYPNFQAGQQCRNCTLFEGGDAAWGPCSIFPGKRVNANGWCATYAPKA